MSELEAIRARAEGRPALWGTSTQASKDRVALLALLDEVTKDRDELQATFDIAWNAQMRGIKHWQKAHPDKRDTWPDMAVLVEWLLTKAFPDD